MKLLKSTITISVLAISLCTQIHVNVSSTKSTLLKENNRAELICDHSGNYRYTREYRDGVWWIVVYNEDGVKVIEFPDPNQA